MFFTTHLFLDVSIKYLFLNRQLHEFTVDTTDGEDLHVPKRPPPSTGDLVKCQLENYIFFSSIML